MSFLDTLSENMRLGNSLLFPFLPAVSIIELLIVLTIASLAYFIVFNNFEKHLPT
jgi:Tfp pilus assembly protein FimT